MRCCASDSGSTRGGASIEPSRPGADRGPAIPPLPPAPRPSELRTARAPATRLSIAAPTRATTWVAISELPPSSKKSSSTHRRDPITQDLGEHLGDEFLDRGGRLPGTPRR